MKKAVLAVAILVGALAAFALSWLTIIEVGREVVVLRTPLPDGSWYETRLWIVDDGKSSWLHSAGANWEARFEGDPVVELERGGEVIRLRAQPVPGPHPEVDRLLREKYGFADRWVRFLAPDTEETLPVRLDPL